MSYSQYSDEEIDRVRVIRRERSPAPVHYVEARRERPRSRAYYEDPFHNAPAHDRTMVTTTRIRERSRERRSPPGVALAPPAPLAPPLVINNNITDRHHHSSDDDSIGSSYNHRGRSRRESHVSYRHHSHSRSRSRAGSGALMTLERYELERRLDEHRRELEHVRLGAPPSELERLRRERRDLEAANEAVQRAKDAEITRLRRAQEEIERARREQIAEQLEEEHYGQMKRDAEFRSLKERSIHEQRVKEAEERRLHDLEDFELREAKRKLQMIEQRNKMEKEATERARDAKTQAELKAAKDELDKIHKAKEEEAERERIIKEHALAELEKKQAAEKAAAARKKADEEAVQRWHIAQAEKAAKEKKEKEEAEAELRNRMRERLLASGVPEAQIQAMIEGKRPMPPHMVGFNGQPMMPMGPPMHQRPMMVGPPVPPPVPMHPHPGTMEVANAHTRIRRKHLSIEALRAKFIDDWEFDKNPEYIIIKRRMAPHETDALFELTKVIRRDREKITTTLTVEDRGKRHHRDRSRDNNLVLVRKTKHERSRSPSVLMYLAGGKR